ncbi:MAG: (Fe-S)-binding protein, partial [Pseudomonadota bacterium]|nr:(Fe-S)-binding protein [Pseudomonadota bacterium]
MSITQSWGKKTFSDGLLENCIECNRCVETCDFLAAYGNPREIDVRLSAALEPEIPYSCSLCSACETVCPVDVPIKEYFLARRQECVAAGQGPLPAHRGLLYYERMVSSSLFTSYFLPPGARRVLFPGCGAIGKAPQTIKKLYANLQRKWPGPLGLVLDCCLKISHDLGREEFFTKQFTILRHRLQEAGITEVVTLCPSCTDVFRNHSDFIVTPVYNCLTENDETVKLRLPAKYAVHDACVLRRDKETQTAVRQLLTQRGATLAPLPLEGEHTVCCGEGGGAWCLDKNLSTRYRERRMQGCVAPMVVYCYACRDFLDPQDESEIVHILELIFGSENRYPGWRTWLNRRSLKNYVK